MQEPIKLGGVVRLKKTGERYEVAGVVEGGSDFYIMLPDAWRTAPFGDGMWVRADEIESAGSC
jgi:hypothetical protein